MTQSQQSATSTQGAIIWKITGRYVVKNLPSIIARAPKRFDAYVDMKNRPLRWMDMRLMAWTTTVYDRIFHGVVDDLGATFMRHYFASTCQSAQVVRCSLNGFGTNRKLTGFAVGINRNYSKGFNLLKFYVRSVSGVIAPWY